MNRKQAGGHRCRANNCTLTHSPIELAKYNCNFQKVAFTCTRILKEREERGEYTNVKVKSCNGQMINTQEKGQHVRAAVCRCTFSGVTFAGAVTWSRTSSTGRHTERGKCEDRRRFIKSR